MDASSVTAASSGKLRVVVAENFWGSIVAQLAGTKATVASIITNPDTDPHDYEAKPSDGRTIASSSTDTTGLIWDVTFAGQRLKVASTELTARDLQTRWADLADDDGAKAFEAICALALAPGQAAPFLAKQLQPAAGVDAKLIEQLITDLDSAQFKQRKKAS